VELISKFLKILKPLSQALQVLLQMNYKELHILLLNRYIFHVVNALSRHDQYFNSI